MRWAPEWQKIEWLIGAVITIAAVYLHWVNLRSAGALWRDEAGIARIAILPSLREIWSNLGHESCPILFPVLLRGWSFIVGSSDAALRVFGFIIGLSLLSAVWLSGWLFYRSVPIIALGLAALNPSIVRWGDSVRAYGLGSMLMLLTLLTVWRFVRAPDCRRWLAAAVAGVMSVQCLFQNSFLLLAACSAAAAVAALRRDYRNAVASLAIGVLAAISLLPYFGIIREVQDWSVLSQIGFLPGLIWKSLSDMMAPTISPLRWLWIGLAAFAIAACVNSGRVLSHRTEDDANTRALFAGAALLAALIAFCLFLWLAKMPTQVWYFLALATFGSVCIDAALVDWPARCQFWRWIVPIVAIGCLPLSLQSVACRQSNMDVVASVLNERAEAHDLIVVHPWTFGVSFNRQYSGSTPWTTVPPLPDHRFHRYDLFKTKMILENPARPVCEQIAATLQAGNWVWLVGQIPLSQTPPPQIQPAPNNPWGWLDDIYSDVWGAQVGYFVAMHATRGEAITSSSPNPISPLEDVQLFAVTGWQEPSESSPTAAKHQ
jgi:hypothetical protein